MAGHPLGLNLTRLSLRSRLREGAGSNYRAGYVIVGPQLGDDKITSNLVLFENCSKFKLEEFLLGIIF